MTAASCSSCPRAGAARADGTVHSGSGLNSVQKEVLNIMETGNADDPGDLSVQSIRKQLLALEKGINKNRDMRTKFGNDPAK